MKIDHVLNVRNMLCPMPVIKTQNQLKKMANGELLQIICSDPGVKHDIPAWCKINSYMIIDQHEQGDEFTFIIKA